MCRSNCGAGLVGNQINKTVLEPWQPNPSNLFKMAKVVGGGKRSRASNDPDESFGKKTESMRKAKEYESGCFSMLSAYRPFYEKLKMAGLAVNKDKIIKCMVELSRYLAIKAMRNDIIASPRIQQVLHELLLFPQFYYNLCRILLSGNDRSVIDNNPLLTHSSVQNQVFIDIYKSYFGTPDPEYWPIAANSNKAKEITINVRYMIGIGGVRLTFREEVTANKTIASLHEKLCNVLEIKGHIVAADKKFIQFNFPNKSAWTTNISCPINFNKNAAEFTFADYKVSDHDNIVAENVAKKVITVRVFDQTGDILSFKVAMSTKLEKVFLAYGARRGVDISALRFLIEDIRPRPEDTPFDLGLVDGDSIHVMLEAVGC